MNVTEQIQVISSVVQAISSVILIVVTAVYVVITQRILQVPNQSFMKPIEKRSRKRGLVYKGS